MERILKHKEYLITAACLGLMMAAVWQVDMPILKVVMGFGFAAAFGFALSTCAFRSHFITLALLFGTLAVAVELYGGGREGKSHFFYLMFHMSLIIGGIKRTYDYWKRRIR